MSLGTIALGALPVAVLVAHRFELASLDARLASRLAALGALPAALTVWLAHPLHTLWAISHRRRKRADPSLLFWREGLVLGFLSGVGAALAHRLDDPSWPLLFGWLAIWGWPALMPRISSASCLSWSGFTASRRWWTGAGVVADHASPSGVRAAPRHRSCSAFAILTTSDWAARLTSALLVATGATWLGITALRPATRRRTVT